MDPMLSASFADNIGHIFCSTRVKPDAKQPHRAQETDIMKILIHMLAIFLVAFIAIAMSACTDNNDTPDDDDTTSVTGDDDTATGDDDDDDDDDDNDTTPSDDDDSATTAVNLQPTLVVMNTLNQNQSSIKFGERTKLASVSITAQHGTINVEEMRLIVTGPSYTKTAEDLGAMEVIINSIHHGANTTNTVYATQYLRHDLPFTIPENQTYHVDFYFTPYQGTSDFNVGDWVNLAFQTQFLKNFSESETGDVQATPEIDIQFHDFYFTTEAGDDDDDDDDDSATINGDDDSALGDDDDDDDSATINGDDDSATGDDDSATINGDDDDSAVETQPQYANALIMGETFTTVYIVNETGDGRYTFPYEEVYLSWYDNFNTVELVTDEVIAALIVGGVITMPPGSLVKVTTSPRVYAVDENAVIHWIEDQATAQRLFGVNWATKVHDIPNVFFSSYTLGDSLNNTTQEFTPDVPEYPYQMLN